MRRPLCLAALLYCFVILVFLNLTPPAVEDDSAWDRTEVVVQGRVDAKEYKMKDDGSIVLLVTLKGCIVSGAEENMEPSGKILCRVGDGSREEAEWSDSHTPIGASVRIGGTLRTFSRATNEGEFDSARYYRTMGYAGFALRQARVEAWKTKEGLWSGSEQDSDIASDAFGNVLYLLKRFFASILDQSVSEEDAGILKAMLLGEKGGLSSEIRQLYKDSGIIHILAISGLHISIIGMGLYRLLRKMTIPLAPSAAGAVAVMLLYGKMTGMGASSFRAICMFLLHMTAIVLHRTYDILTALGAAALLLLFQQPLYILDSGFQFSFGAVLGIALLAPAFASRTMKGLAVTFAVIPVYLISYGTFPVWSILLNLAVLPLMSVVMTGGLATLAVGTVFSLFRGISAMRGSAAADIVQSRLENAEMSFAAASAASAGINEVVHKSAAVVNPAGFVTHLVLLFYKSLCRASQLLPWHQLNPGAPAAWEILLYLVILAGIVYWSGKIPELLKVLAVALGLIILCLRIQSGVDIYVLDVGQGDGMLIRHGGVNILIDGGSTSKNDLSQYQLTPFLQHKGVKTLDYCIVTHEDEDHINGVLEVIRASRTHSMTQGAAWFRLFEDDSENGIDIGTLCLPSSVENVKTENYRILEEAAAEKGIPVMYMKEGDVLSAQDPSLEKENTLNMTDTNLEIENIHFMSNPDLEGKKELTAAGSTEKEFRLVCLHPEENSSYDEANGRSIVLYLSYGDFSMLFTGDLEGAGEERTDVYAEELAKLYGEDLLSGAGFDADADSAKIPVTVLNVGLRGQIQCTFCARKESA